MPLTDGADFAGFRIVRLLGTGAMGEVYLAGHPRLPRREALKVLPTALSADEQYRQRFVREADLAATLWHPNIVGIHDRGEFEGRLWISMDFVDGIDAAHALRNNHPTGMAPQWVVHIVMAIAGALDHAHQRGLLHRDVKPANILLAHSGGESRVMLSDFGVARQIADISGLTATNMAVGSVAYAAPEQLQGKPIDGRADQYALAATAFHLLTGQPPFSHSNPAVVIGKHLAEAPPRLAEQHPHLADLDMPLGKALAKDPAMRFPRCQDFAAALAHQLAAGQAVTGSAPPPAPPPAPPAAPYYAYPPGAVLPAAKPGPAPPRRTGAAIAVPLLLAVALIGAVVFAVSQAARSDPAPSTAPPQWQPYVDYGATFAENLSSVNPATADRDIQRIVDGSADPFREAFLDQRDSLLKAIAGGQLSMTATAEGAALEAFNDRAQTAVVLVAVTTESVGSSQESRQRLRLTVARTDDTFKVTEVDLGS